MHKMKKLLPLFIAVIVIVAGILIYIFTSGTQTDAQIKDSGGKIQLTVDEKEIKTKSNSINLSGTVICSDGLAKTINISYDVYSQDDTQFINSLFNGDAVVKDGTWTIENVHVAPGDSVVVVSATAGDITQQHSVDVNYDMGTPYSDIKVDDIDFDTELNTKYVNNVISVLVNDGVTEDMLSAVLNNYGAKIAGRVSFVYDVLLDKDYTRSELKSICDDLQQHQEIFYAHVNYMVEPEENAEYWNGKKAYKYWHNGNDWNIDAIDLDGAYKYKDKFSQISIGVVDSGFDLDHKDLNGRFSPSAEQMATINDYYEWDLKKNKNVVDDHGTHVAGIIGAIDNDIGMTGIIDDVNILYTDVSHIYEQSDGKKTEILDKSVFSSLVFSVEAGAKVINYSLGNNASVAYEDFVNFYNSDRSLINMSQKWKDEQAEISSKYMLLLLRRGYDFLIVQSAGNGFDVEVAQGQIEKIAVDASNNGWWSCITANNIVDYATEKEKDDILDRIIVVGNAKRNPDGNYQQAANSNGGARVDICAPGTDIFSTKVDNRYGMMSGTSQAAPHVTAVCGLVWSANRELTGAEVKEIVCNYTSYVVHDNPDGNHPLENEYPMLNVHLAVKEAVRRSEIKKMQIPGSVHDSKTGVAICDVSVKVFADGNKESVYAETKTDKNGKYSFNLPVGDYLITYFHEEYEGSHISITEENDSIETITLLKPKEKKTEPSYEKPAIAFGTCGAKGGNIYWTLYEDGELVIEGEGAMADYVFMPIADDESAAPPYWKYKDKIKKCTVLDGVDYIGTYAFAAFGIKEIVLPDSVEKIGNYAFCYCNNLANVKISENCTDIGVGAFNYCTSLKEITIPASVQVCCGFWECFNLKKIVLLHPQCRIECEEHDLDYVKIISGYKNSTAQTYAKKYNKTFEVID